MHRLTRLTAATALAVGLLFALSAHVPAEPVDPLRAAFFAIGAGRVDAVRYSGIGATFAADPERPATAPWTRTPFHRYDAEADYLSASLRVRVTPVPDGHAVTAPAPRPEAGTRVVDGPAPGEDAVPRAWLTPHGFLKAARAHQARVTSGAHETEIAFEYRGRRVVGFLNDRYQVDRVQTSVAGGRSAGARAGDDAGVEIRFRDYEPMPGMGAFPRHITETRGGRLTLDLWVWAAAAVPASALAAPS